VSAPCATSATSGHRGRVFERVGRERGAGTAGFDGVQQTHSNHPPCELHAAGRVPQPDARKSICADDEPRRCQGRSRLTASCGLTDDVTVTRTTGMTTNQNSRMATRRLGVQRALLRGADGLRRPAAAPAPRALPSRSFGHGPLCLHVPAHKCSWGWHRVTALPAAAHGRESAAPADRLLLQSVRMAGVRAGVARAGSASFAFRRCYQQGSHHQGSFNQGSFNQGSFNQGHGQQSSARLVELCAGKLHNAPHRTAPRLNAPRCDSLHRTSFAVRRAGATAGGMLRTAVVYFLTATGLVVWAVQLGELGMFYFFPDRWPCCRRRANARTCCRMPTLRHPAHSSAAWCDWCGREMPGRDCGRDAVDVPESLCPAMRQRHLVCARCACAVGRLARVCKKPGVER